MKYNVWVTIASLSFALAAPLANAQSPAGGSSGGFDIVEGRHFQRITPAQPTISATGQIEVAEVFMYSCPVCYAFEPHISRWRATLPNYVKFVRIPASFSSLAMLHARAYYTAEAFGRNADIDGPFFEEIHQKRSRLDTEDALVGFFSRFGVDEQTFKSTFNSPAVQTSVQHADELVRLYRVGGTPSVVVNGKYMTNGAMAGSYDNWFRIIDELIARERAAAH